MDDSKTTVRTSDGQVSTAAAEIYDSFFVPSLFAEWAPRLADAVGMKPGERALDIACGTGVVARELAARAGKEGRVTGLDINPGMLAMAKRIAAQNGLTDIDWRQGAAEALPCDDDSFDVATCQFGLMFFEDRAKSLAEMRRLLKPGGRCAVATWAALDSSPGSPGYRDMVALLDRLFGADIANELRGPFLLGDPDEVAAMLRDAGFADVRAELITGEARFPSIERWVFTDVKGWTLADKIDPAQFETLRAAAETEMQRYVQSDGSVRFPNTAIVATGRKA